MPDPHRPLSEGKSAALRLLTLARDDADDMGEPAHQFAVGIHELVAAGAAKSDVLWLIKMRWVHHFYDRTPEGQSRRELCAAADAPLRDNSCFLLSDLGKVYVQANRRGCPAIGKSARPADERSPRERVRWDALRHELWVDDELVKSFTHKAASQWATLDQFEEDGWQGPIEVAPPGDPARDSGQRLRELIAELNKNLHASLIHFRKDCGSNRITFDLK